MPHPSAAAELQQITIDRPAPRPEGGVSEGGTPKTIEEKLANLRRQLKENESQRTEVNGYINQLNIQLHRWQIRMQTLDERNKELKAEVVNCVTEESRGAKK